MNKKALTTKVAKQAGLTIAEATKSIDAAFASIKESIESGDSIIITGFGTFSVSNRAERRGINPTTQQIITIPARKVMKFKPSKSVEIK